MVRMSDLHRCPRCGEPFPDEEHAEERANWTVIAQGEEVVCPQCATPAEQLAEELDAMGVRTDA
jgi:endogenous inhibitor of DNA gyrase (YacG/DUF329 family)